MIDLDTLLAAGLSVNTARTFLPTLREACAQYSINTPRRVAAFLAQASYESAAFTRLEESLFYTRAERVRQVWPKQIASLDEAAKLLRNPKGLALAVYSNRMGNGAAESGDGWAFRGRGVFQLTGRDNYADAAMALGHPYLVRPELVAQPEHACLTAAYYWHDRELNRQADIGDIDGVTRSVNGRAMLGAAERRAIYDEILEATNV